MFKYVFLTVLHNCVGMYSDLSRIEKVGFWVGVGMWMVVFVDLVIRLFGGSGI